MEQNQSREVNLVGKRVSGKIHGPGSIKSWISTVFSGDSVEYLAVLSGQFWPPSVWGIDDQLWPVRLRLPLPFYSGWELPAEVAVPHPRLLVRVKALIQQDQPECRMLIYSGFHDCPSHCDLEVVRRSVTPLAICTELADNPGTSVTTLAEHLATRVCEDDPSIAPEHLI